MSRQEKIKFISNWIKDNVNNMPSKAQSLVIGITAGASTPEVLVKELVNHIKQNFGYNIDVEILDGEQEKVSFNFPELVR